MKKIKTETSKNKKPNEQNRFAIDGLLKIRTELRNWYGSLSVKELVSNRTLVAEIENLERILSGMWCDCYGNQ
mgnify:CR=1 FL=1